MLEIIGYIGALIMGLVLGLTGSGGAILTVPILVYLFSVDAVLATTYSLGIVGITSIVGSINQAKHDNISWKIAATFGFASVLGVFVARRFLLPLMPDVLFSIGNFTLQKGIALLLLFAVLMLMGAYSMLKKKEPQIVPILEEIHPILLISKGLGIGLLTGFVGASGGFLIIPTLIFGAGLSMKKAVGTSTFIVMLNCLLGFVISLPNTESLDWRFMSIFVSIAMIGIVTGIEYATKISNEKLKYGFGWFIVLMGTFIIGKELIMKVL
jgi:uncharacterized membrane protein YfcA